MKRINSVYESRELRPIINLRNRTLVGFTFRANSKLRHQVIIQNLNGALGLVPSIIIRRDNLIKKELSSHAFLQTR